MSFIIFAVVVVYFLWGMSSASAAGPDFSPLTSSVDYSTAIIAILAVMAGLAGVYIVMSAGSLILERIRLDDEAFRESEYRREELERWDRDYRDY